MKKKVAILGSTGSIGKSTLEIIKKYKSYFKVELLSGSTNYNLLVNQSKIFKPKYIYTNNKLLSNKLIKFTSKNKIKLINDIDEIKKNKFDISISAISGVEGLIPTYKIIKFTKNLGIANKESIICGWPFLKKEMKKFGCSFFPLDSEHFSIYKLLEKKNISTISKVFLTASGGPFFNKKINLSKVTPKQAVKHPKWKMGKKISVDSANLFNKILEIIEASLIFDLPINKFSFVIHPESKVHAIVNFRNNFSSMIYHDTDMKIPIMNFLFMNNKKIITSNDNFLSTNKIQLNFYKFDVRMSVYRIFNFLNKLNFVGYIVLNCANEFLVSKFLNNEILFEHILKNLCVFFDRKDIQRYVKNTKITSIYDINDIIKFTHSKLV